MSDENAQEINLRLDDSANARKWIRRVIFLCFASFYFAVIAANVIVFFEPFGPNLKLSDLLLSHYSAIVGLPCAALLSFAVVWSYRTTDGPFEIEMWGLKFKGAAGPIVMWVLVFGVSASAVKMLY